MKVRVARLRQESARSGRSGTHPRWLSSAFTADGFGANVVCYAVWSSY